MIAVVVVVGVAAGKSSSEDQLQLADVAATAAVEDETLDSVVLQCSFDPN